MWAAGFLIGILERGAEAPMTKECERNLENFVSITGHDIIAFMYMTNTSKGIGVLKNYFC